MSDADVVLALEKTWSTAPRAGDLETVNEVADDRLGVGPAGQTMTKDLPGMLAARPNLFDTTAYSDVRLSLFSTTAVIISSFHGVEEAGTQTTVYAGLRQTRKQVALCRHPNHPHPSDLNAELSF